MRTAPHTFVYPTTLILVLHPTEFSVKLVKSLSFQGLSLDGDCDPIFPLVEKFTHHDQNGDKYFTDFRQYSSQLTKEQIIYKTTRQQERTFRYYFLQHSRRDLRNLFNKLFKGDLLIKFPHFSCHGDNNIFNIQNILFKSIQTNPEETWNEYHTRIFPFTVAISWLQNFPLSTIQPILTGIHITHNTPTPGNKKYFRFDKWLSYNTVNGIR